MEQQPNNRIIRAHQYVPMTENRRMGIALLRHVEQLENNFENSKLFISLS
jgi:hypothetical protein